MRCLPLLDPKEIGANPKVFVGYSDLTALLLFFGERCGLVVFHGPTLTNEDLARGEPTSTAIGLRAAVMSDKALPPLTGDSWAGGVAEGPLIGGCLSLIAALCGTPFAPNFADAVVFFEDVNEPVYRLDRMFRQLKMAGALTGLRGIVLGPICSPTERPALRRMLAETLEDKDLPILHGILSGHGDTTLTLPLGAMVRLDGQRGELHFLESGVKGN
jgi:muramoyltetrapeptide carboxypeptidase